MKKNYRKPRAKMVNLDFTSVIADSATLKFASPQAAENNMEMESNSRDGGSDWEGIDGLFDF